MNHIFLEGKGQDWFISALPHQMIVGRACRWSVFNKYWKIWFCKNSHISCFVIYKMEIKPYHSHLQDLFHFQQHQSMSPDSSIKSAPLVMVQHDSVWVCVCVCARACAQLCLTLRPHGLVGLPGSSISGIIQARILEWVAISSSRGSSWPRMGPTSRVSCIDRCVLYHWATWEAHRTTWHSVILHKCIFDYMKEYKLSQNQEGKTNSILLNFKRPR